MPNLIARGQNTWILAAVFGLILMVFGALRDSGMAVGAGATVLALGLIFLMLSLASEGRTS